MSDKKVFKIVKIETGAVSAQKQKALLNKKFNNKDSYSAAKKAANAILKEASKNKKMIKFIIENQKAQKNGKKKELAYTAYRQDEVKEVEIKGQTLKFKASPKVKSCLKSSV